MLFSAHAILFLIVLSPRMDCMVSLCLIYTFTLLFFQAPSHFPCCPLQLHCFKGNCLSETSCDLFVQVLPWVKILMFRLSVVICSLPPLPLFVQRCPPFCVIRCVTNAVFFFHFGAPPILPRHGKQRVSDIVYCELYIGRLD